MDKENAEFDNLKYNQGFNNHFETEAKEGAIPKSNFSLIKIKTIHLNLSMDFTQNNFQALHLPPKEQKTKEVGSTRSDHRLFKGNILLPNMTIRLLIPT